MTDAFTPEPAMLPGGQPMTESLMAKTMGKIGSHFRQGDVLPIRIEAIPADAKPLPRDNGSVVYAYGEVTGHSHQLRGPNVTMFRDDAGHAYASVTASEVLVHEEHSAIIQTPGAYELGQQVRYLPQMLLREAD